MLQGKKIYTDNFRKIFKYMREKINILPSHQEDIKKNLIPKSMFAFQFFCKRYL
jgi:hypothetical protein